MPLMLMTTEFVTTRIVPVVNTHIVQSKSELHSYLIGYETKRYLAVVLFVRMFIIISNQNIKDCFFIVSSLTYHIILIGFLFRFSLGPKKMGDVLFSRL
jgi:hypothetical protein